MILTSTSTLNIDADVLGDAASPPPAIAASEDPDGEVATGGGAEDLNSVQRDHILATLRNANWVVEGESGAALRLGMKPATLRHRMKRLGISRQSDPAG